MAEINEYYKQLLKIGKDIASFSRRTESEAENAQALNKTERRLITILYVAETEGERLISTQIADRLGVTRSAVSQIVDKLEAARYVKRVPSVTDKKIAYIELSANSKEVFAKSVKKNYDVLEMALSRMGEKDVERMLELADCFTRTVKEVEKERAEV